jgi:general secretion pathway protein G
MQRPPARLRSRGFTLVELMAVTVILGGLITIVGTNILRAIHDADISKAEAQMVLLGSALEQYYLRHRKVPSSLEVLTEQDPKTGAPFIRHVPKDPWGNAYQLRLEGGEAYGILSMGKDAQEGTEDDVAFPKQE